MKRLFRKLEWPENLDGFRLIQRPERRKRVIHFLHIGKNAGSQVMSIANQFNDLSRRRTILKRKHDIFLKDIPSDDDYFFSIRDPISRVRSGFYSRKRKGQPRIYSEWSAYDELAFSEFEHANDLAECLFGNGETGARAWAAMKSIRHTAQNQSDWFYCCGNFLRVRPPIFIIRQESFDRDISAFIGTADPDVEISRIRLSSNAVESHRNDYSGVPPLSPRAIENLRSWYAQDFSFCKLCNDWIEDHF